MGFKRKKELEDFACSYGYAIYREGHDVEIYSNVAAGDVIHRRYPVFSITKTFIASLVLKFSQNGLVDLGSPVGTYLDGIKEDWVKELSLRNLLIHRSGLGDYGYVKDYSILLKQRSAEKISESDLIDMVTRQGLQFEQGEKFSYANIGYLLLRRVLESVSGVSFAKLAQESVFEPFAMKDSLVATSLDNMSGISWPHNQSESIVGGDVSKDYHPSWVSHGLILSTISDLQKFYSRLFNGELLNDQSKKLLFAPLKLEFPGEILSPHYGYGVMGDPNSEIGRVLGHDGGGPGFSVSAYSQFLDRQYSYHFLVLGKEGVHSVDVVAKLIKN